MIELIDLGEIRRDGFDLNELRALVKQLIGQPFRFFRVSCGDELRLHLGELRNYPSPKMKALRKGSYVVATRASSWVVFSAGKQVLVTSDEVHDEQPITGINKGGIEIRSIERGDFIVPESLVISATADRASGGFTLKLGFSDTSHIYISPEPPSVEDLLGSDVEFAEDSDEAIADWEVMTPHQRILKAGPGESWSYTDSKAKPRQRNAE